MTSLNPILGFIESKKVICQDIILRKKLIVKEMSEFEGMKVTLKNLFDVRSLFIAPMVYYYLDVSGRLQLPLRGEIIVDNVFPASFTIQRVSIKEAISEILQRAEREDEKWADYAMLMAKKGFIEHYLMRGFNTFRAYKTILEYKDPKIRRFRDTEIKYYYYAESPSYIIIDDSTNYYSTLFDERVLDDICVLAHADFSKLKAPRDPVPPELDEVRKEVLGRKPLRYYGFLTSHVKLTLYDLDLLMKIIDEIVLLKDLLRKYRVYTADAKLADEVVLMAKEAKEELMKEYLEAYRKSIVEVKDYGFPRYETYIETFLSILKVWSNEFMVIPK